MIAIVANPSGTQSVSLDKLTKTALEACLHSGFRFEPKSSDPFDARLIEVTGLTKNKTGTADGRAPFSAVFCGPKGLHVPQGTYRFEHDRLGRVELFIVPIGPNDEGMCFEAVFN